MKTKDQMISTAALLKLNGMKSSEIAALIEKLRAERDEGIGLLERAVVFLGGLTTGDDIKKYLAKMRPGDG